ncbi:MAG: oligosaccharide flippase family protein, partial [Muribaculaceae bacterium]|nr:oligosaccharide flippase family protein [Muribaculaceae bacterium]
MRKQNVMVNNQSRTAQAFWLGLGSVVSFMFGLVSTAVLSRILPVSEYGTYRQVLYVYATLQIVFSLGLPRAYSFFLPRLPIEEGRRSVDKINLIFIGAGLLFGVILYIFSGMIAGLLNNEALGPCLRRFSPTPVFLLPVLGLESVMATYRRTYFTVIYVIISRVLNLV